jgi:hypothetical protein
VQFSFVQGDSSEAEYDSGEESDVNLDWLPDPDKIYGKSEDANSDQDSSQSEEEEDDSAEERR